MRPLVVGIKEDFFAASLMKNGLLGLTITTSDTGCVHLLSHNATRENVEVRTYH